MIFEKVRGWVSKQFERHCPQRETTTSGELKSRRSQIRESVRSRINKHLCSERVSDNFPHVTGTYKTVNKYDNKLATPERLKKRLQSINKNNSNQSSVVAREKIEDKTDKFRHFNQGSYLDDELLGEQDRC